MKLFECINSLKEEKTQKMDCRFPCRAILLHSREDYQYAVASLKSLCDRTVSPEELFSGADLMPAYDKALDGARPGEWLLLPGVSEYLRLFYKSEQKSGRLAKLWHSIVDASNTGRVIIPLWNCDALWHDNSLGFQTDERQEDYVYNIENDALIPEKMSILVFSSAFEEYIGQLSGKFSLIVGLREWYERMMEDTKLFQDYCLLTKQTRSITPVAGDITIRVINDTFTFVRENLQNGHVLKEADCQDGILDELFEESLKNASVNDAILHRFNVLSFDGNFIMSKWNGMSDSKKQLIKLWYHLNPDSSYLCRCIESYKLSDVEDHILLDIFDVMQYHPEWVNEWQSLVTLLNVNKNEKFFTKLNAIPVFEERLPFLSSSTKEERIYILRMVGQWLRQDANQVRSSKELQMMYPQLQAYLSALPNSIEPVYDEYMADYKAHKLANTLPESDEVFFRGIEPDTLPYRYAVLNQNIKDSTTVLWIDAMGFEYLSLLLQALGANDSGNVLSAELVQASLPTETKYNEQWKQMSVKYEKLDKLDKLAHKGVVDEPDYYTCIEEQLMFFGKVSDTVSELLKNYHRVIITGDHGTSRLAARFFHARDGLPAPKNATVLSHGRYCSVESVPATTYEMIKEASDAAGTHYLVFSSYDHFTIGGFAAGGDDSNARYGEVHGGATPEEMIVPVVVFESKQQLPLTVKWADQKPEVKLKKRIAKTKLEFSRDVKSLQVKFGAIDASCASETGKVWSITLERIEPGQYTPVIVADGQFINIDMPLTVLLALGGGGDL